MFGKTTIPQRKPFQLSSDQISQDIEAISLDQEQRNKLYFCLDKKTPYEHQFSKVEEFLKGTDNLEDSKQKLERLTDDIECLVRDINKKVGDIQGSIGNCSLGR